jgi:hypothetical protein
LQQGICDIRQTFGCHVRHGGIPPELCDQQGGEAPPLSTPALLA